MEVTSDYDLTALIESCGRTGDLLVTYTMTDDCDNTKTMTAHYTIIDTIPPSVVNCDLALDTIVDCIDSTELVASCDAWNAGNIAHLDTCAADLCDTDVTVTSDYDLANLESACGNTGDLLVHYVIADDCGNSTTVTAHYTIIDTLPPDLSLCTEPLDATVDCDLSVQVENCRAWNEANIARLEACATDLCDDTLTVTSNYERAPFFDSCGNTGYLLVTYTITDDCENMSQMTARYTIIDTMPPTVDLCPSLNDTVDCNLANLEAQCAGWNANNMYQLMGCARDLCERYARRTGR